MSDLTSRSARKSSGAGSDATAGRILDAAVGVLVDFGVKRATVELVAKAAGVSHMTIYRRWPTRNDLFYAAIVREFTRLCDEAFRPAGADGLFEDIVVDAFSTLVWSVQSHPLMARELRTEPEVVLPLLTTASAVVMRTAVTVMAGHLRRTSQVTGAALEDPDALADILVRLAHSMLLVPHPTQPLTTRAHIDEYARRYTLPLTRSAMGIALSR